MIIKFKGFDINANTIQEFARCICEQIPTPAFIKTGTQNEAQFLTEAVRFFVSENLTTIREHGEYLMRLMDPVIEDLFYYCVNQGYQPPEIHFFDGLAGNESGTTFSKYLPLYIKFYYPDICGKEQKAPVLPFKLQSSEIEKFWELEKKIFLPSSNTVYICSPLRGITPEETYQNMLAARRYMLSAYRLTGDPAVAPHAYLPVVMDDSIPEEREYALKAGKKLLSRCKYLFACGESISEGMKGEIEEAALLGIPIVTFSRGMFRKVTDIICSDDAIGCGGGVRLMLGYDELSAPAAPTK